MTADPVAFCTFVNESYVPGLAALLNSLTVTNPHVAVPFLVYLAEDISEASRRRLKNLYPNIQYREVEVGLYAACQFSNYREWGLNPAYRYELFLNREFEQLVYLDTDTIVIGDIRELLAYRGPVSACLMDAGEGMELASVGGFNAGVMSIGSQVRTPDFWGDLMALAEARPWSGNQTVLNVVLRPYLEPLPGIFNLRTCQFTHASVAAARILHFVGWCKPWQSGEPFDPFQRTRAGQAMCDAALALWRKYGAPAVTDWS